MLSKCIIVLYFNGIKLQYLVGKDKRRRRKNKINRKRRKDGREKAVIKECKRQKYERKTEQASERNLPIPFRKKNYAMKDN